MFRGDRFTKPKINSFVGALLVSVIVWAGSEMSSLFGYIFALVSMLMMIVAMQMDSIWPRERKKENSVVFSLFWGCMLGALLPFLVSVFLDGGFKGLYEMFTQG